MTEPPKKPKIALPSFRDVQAAQRINKPAPNLFQNRPAGASNNAEASSSRPQGPSGGQTNSADGYARATGVFADPPGPSRAQQAFPPAPSQGSTNPPAGPSMAGPSSFQSQGFRQGSSGAGPSGNFFGAGPSSGSFQPAQPMVDYNAMNASPNAILVSKRQEGNPLLKHMRNVRWTYADIIPDYVMGADSCALFLSMRFHLLKPDYIYHRIKELANSFKVRILMCHVDIDDVVEPLHQITRAAVLNGVTLICGWSPEECARYLETYKAFETKPADSIKGHTDEDFLSRLTAALTTIRGVNKTDVLTLGSTFKTPAGIMQASAEDLAGCPGIGPTKVQRLYETFHKPFRKGLQPVASNNLRLARLPAVAGRQITANASSHDSLTASTQIAMPEIGDAPNVNVFDALDMAEEIENSDDEDYAM